MTNAINALRGDCAKESTWVKDHLAQLHRALSLCQQGFLDIEKEFLEVNLKFVKSSPSMGDNRVDELGDRMLFLDEPHHADGSRLPNKQCGMSGPHPTVQRNDIRLPNNYYSMEELCSKDGPRPPAFEPRSSSKNTARRSLFRI